MSYGCVIIDFEGYELSSEERELIQHPAVAGVILFTRNYHDKAQVSALTQAINKIRSPLIISVDQEGGRVQRFRSGFSDLPPMAYFGELYQKNPQQARAELIKTVQIMVTELQEVGVNVNWAPVLDVDHGVSQIIGNRSFSVDVDTLIDLAETFINSFHKMGMPVIGKHFPGHGAVVADSHLELPIDDRSWEMIEQVDLKPFAKLAQVLDAIMPAHVVYKMIDSQPAGFSAHWLQSVLRQQLAFKGVIVSDDLTMAGAAIGGSYSERAQLALKAGCDLLPVCNNRKAAIEVLEAVQSTQNQESSQRIKAFMQKIKSC